MASPSSSASNSLVAFGEAFQHSLDEMKLHPGLSVSLSADEQTRLWLLAQHRAPEATNPGALLRQLEAAFRELVTEVGLPEDPWATLPEIPVRLSLKVNKGTRPYSTHTFTWRLADAAAAVFPVTSSVSGGEQTAVANQADLGAESSHQSPASLAAEAADLPAAGTTTVLALPSSEMLAMNDTAFALPDTSVDSPDRIALLRGWCLTGIDRLKPLVKYWSYGLAGLIVLSSGAFAYAVTRPCVVGGCDRIERASALQTQALSQITQSPNRAPNRAPNRERLEAAQTDLRAATQLLQAVPRWSRYYPETQAALQQQQQTLTDVKRVEQAMTKATQAAELSQDPPHPVAQWVDIQQLWAQAIGFLEQVPAASPLHGLAQQKLAEYQDNHKIISQRITIEEDATANLNTAIQTGQLAMNRMETAVSLPGWQLAKKEWQAAVLGLSLIPRGTAVYAEAQDYLKDYRQHLLETNFRVNVEESATRSYQQAQQAAAQARTAESQNQWTQAVLHWRTALRNAQSVSSDAAVHPEAETLIASYEPALTKAQAQLRAAVALQRLQAALDQVCAGSSTPCTVSSVSGQIRMALSSEYALALRQALTPPGTGNTLVVAAEIPEEAQALIDQIMAMGNQGQQPIAIYDAHGGFIARYRPDLGGFIKH